MTRADVCDITECANWIDVLQTRARRQPDRCAYVWRQQSGDAPAELTYGELDRRARAIAARLQVSCRPGQGALLLYPPGLEFIAGLFGALYAGLVAVPVQAAARARDAGAESRQQAVLADARPDVLLTSRAVLEKVEEPDGLPSLRLVTDDVSDRHANEWSTPDVDGDSLALLQYTSGSTASPRGVMLTHGNLLYNSSMIYRAYGHSPDSRGVIWLPPFHDMGLIGGVLQPLYGGFPVTLTHPSSFLLNPLSWLRMISETGATTSGGPNFAYDLCVRKIPPERRRLLDLSCWQVAFNGADVVRPESLDEFSEAFAECGFRREAFVPCYGLAESTLMVTSSKQSEPPIVLRLEAGALRERRVVNARHSENDAHVVRAAGCGRVDIGADVVIVDPDTKRRCLPEEVGEVWVAGPSVARGYWQRPEATDETFAARLAGSDKGPFLRTGDLGFLRDGELFVTGRLKDLLIFAGRNHHPEDIEWTASNSHTALEGGGCAAFTVDVEREERLVIAAELERSWYRRLKRAHRRSAAGSAAERESGGVQLAVEEQTAAVELEKIVESVRRAVAECDGLSVYRVVPVKPAALPRTTSGKIQRRFCRSAWLKGVLKLVEHDA